MTSPPRDLLDRPPEALASALQRLGRRRVLIARDLDSGRLRAHPPALEELAAFARDPRSGERRHEAIFVEASRTGALFAAFVHRVVRGQAQGGLRRRRYATLRDLLGDGLRLSLAMGRKNALAGLWWGGGKGILAPKRADLGPASKARRRLYQEYGEFVTSLRGLYVTAEDVGTTPGDLAETASRTRFLTCIPPERGGSGNPSRWTAAGVVVAMEAALEARGAGSAAGRRVAMQGGGQVGAAMIEELLARGVASIAVAETSAERCRHLAERFASRGVEVRRVERDDASILAEPCDVLAPNALGGVLGPETIPQVRATVVCGAANAPLADEERDARALAERGITYVPDFVANRLGIVHCANEQYGYVPNDPAIRRHLDPAWEDSIPAVTRRVLQEAERERLSSVATALRLADARLETPHPIWGRRAEAILGALVEEGWVDG